MGWCSGGELFWDICKEASKYIKDDNDFKKFVDKSVISFERHDADTLFDDIDKSRLGKIMKQIAEKRGYYD